MSCKPCVSLEKLNILAAGLGLFLGYGYSKKLLKKNNDPSDEGEPSDVGEPVTVITGNPTGGTVNIIKTGTRLLSFGNVLKLVGGVYIAKSTYNALIQAGYTGEQIRGAVVTGLQYAVRMGSRVAGRQRPLDFVGVLEEPLPIPNPPQPPPPPPVRPPPPARPPPPDQPPDDDPDTGAGLNLRDLGAGAAGATAAIGGALLAGGSKFVPGGTLLGAAALTGASLGRGIYKVARKISKKRERALVQYTGRGAATTTSSASSTRGGVVNPITGIDLTRTQSRPQRRINEKGEIIIPGRTGSADPGTAAPAGPPIISEREGAIRAAQLRQQFSATYGFDPMAVEDTSFNIRDLRGPIRDESLQEITDLPQPEDIQELAESLGIDPDTFIPIDSNDKILYYKASQLLLLTIFYNDIMALETVTDTDISRIYRILLNRQNEIFLAKAIPSDIYGDVSLAGELNIIFSVGERSEGILDDIYLKLEAIKQTYESKSGKGVLFRGILRNKGFINIAKALKVAESTERSDPKLVSSSRFRRLIISKTIDLRDLRTGRGRRPTPISNSEYAAILRGLLSKNTPGQTAARLTNKKITRQVVINVYNRMREAYQLLRQEGYRMKR